MRQYLTVSVAAEQMTRLFQIRTQLAMIFNDPIMNNHHPFGSDMRMSICLGHPTMRGPARMADANITTKRVLANQAVKTCQFANRPSDFKTSAIMGDNASTVIAAIFEAP